MLWIVSLLTFIIGSILTHVGKRKENLSVRWVGETLYFIAWILWTIGVFAYDRSVWMDIFAIAWLLFAVISNILTVEFSFSTKKSKGA